MLTSKQRAALKAMANSLEPIIHVGKAGVTDNVIMQADEALTARELIKGTVQQAERKRQARRKYSRRVAGLCFTDRGLKTPV